MGSPFIHFLDELSAISETDYGDFMRKVNSYLLELKENDIAKNSAEISEKLDNMQDYVQFHPNWDLESTKEKIFRDADKLVDLESRNST